MYQLINESSVLRLIDGASIPMCDTNNDYQSYLKWLAEGNQPLPADNPQRSEA